VIKSALRHVVPAAQIGESRVRLMLAQDA
jgi:hypothetical protein